MSEVFDGATFYQTPDGRWQVSLRYGDGWRVYIEAELEDAIASALGKDIDMAPRKARTTKKATNDVAAKLTEAMKFLAVGHKASGNVQAQHTWFSGDGWACSFDGIIAAGVPLEGIDFKAYANTALMVDALKHVGKELELTVSDYGVHFTSGDYEATVPLGDVSTMVPTPPDPQLATLDQRFRMGLELCGRVISDTATTVRDACVFLKPSTPGAQVAYTAIATNGKIVIEAKVADGAIPAGLLLPKAFITALTKAASLGVECVGWGYSPQTFTAHMSNGGFIRAQLYLEAYDDRVVSMVDGFLSSPLSAPAPKGFFEAVEAVAPFGDGVVYFIAGNVCAGPDDEAEKWNAVQSVDKLPDGVGTIGRWLLAFREEAQSIWLGDENDPSPRVVLNGEMFRAAVLGFPVSARPKPVEPAAQTNTGVPLWQSLNTQPAFEPPTGWGDPGDTITF